MIKYFTDKYIKRCLAFIEGSIKKFDLDLSDYIVYTELGSRNYAYTPVIAAMAGAKKVYAITKDSIYGTIFENKQDLKQICRNLEGMQDKITVDTKKIKNHLHEADILTNTGFVRPIDKKMIDYLQKTCVIPLMYESWESRAGKDIDLDRCREKGILVCGTNEDCKPMDMMRYSGFLLSKMMFTCGFGVHKDSILLIGSGRIASNLNNFLLRNSIKFDHFSLGYLSRNKLDLSNYDAIVTAEHYDNIELIGKDGLIKVEDIKKSAPLCQILHICGNVDANAIRDQEISIYPRLPSEFGSMSFTADFIGPKATLELIVAGLKVGQLMATNRKKNNLSCEKAINVLRREPLVECFMGG